MPNPNPETPTAKLRRILDRLRKHPLFGRLIKQASPDEQGWLLDRLASDLPLADRTSLFQAALSGNLAKAIHALEPVVNTLRKSYPHARWQGDVLLQQGRSMVLATVQDDCHVLRKATLKPNQHWITIHPHGSEEGGRGVPVIIQDHPDGTASIIGGAGGKLTGLKLSHVADPEEWKARQKEKAKEKKAAAKEKKEALATSGNAETYAEATQSAKSARVDADMAFIRRAQGALGWDDKVITPAEDPAYWKAKGKSSLSISTLMENYRGNLVRQAKDAVAEVKLEAAGDDSLRHDLYHQPAADADTTLTASDFLTDKGAGGTGKGYKSPITREALDTVKGELDPTRLDEEIAAASHHVLATSGDETLSSVLPLANRHLQHLQAAKAALEAGNTDAAAEHKLAANQFSVRADLREQRIDSADNPADRNVAIKDAVDIANARVDELRSAKAEGISRPPVLNKRAAELRQMADLLAAAKRHELDHKGVNKKEQVLRTELAAGAEVGERVRMDSPYLRDTFKISSDLIPDEHIHAQVKADLADEARRTAMSGMLDAMQDPRLATSLASTQDDVPLHFRQHVGAGANAAFTQAAQLGTGIPVVSREAVDALGIKGAAAVQAQHLIESMPPQDFDRFVRALESYHADRITKDAGDALSEANSAIETAASVAPTGGAGADELLLAEKQHILRRDAANTALRTLGVTAGHIEATAELINALHRARRKGGVITVDMGDTAPADVVKKAHMLGLNSGQFEVEQDSGSRFLHITPEGQAAIYARAGSVDPARQSMLTAIKRGDHDETGWLPADFARRPQSSFTDPGTTARQYATTDVSFVGKEGDEMTGAVREYIGSRLVDGEPLKSVRADLLSTGFVGTACGGLSGPTSEHYFDALADLLPRADADIDSLRRDPKYKGMEADFCAAHLARTGEEVAPLDTQSVNPEDPATVEALHRALAENPAAAVAFVPTGRLTRDHKLALRRHFDSRFVQQPRERLLAEAETARNAGDHTSALGLERKAEQYGVTRKEARTTTEQAAAAAPAPAQQYDMFGGSVETTTTPTSETDPSTDVAWDRYLDAHNGNDDSAYAALQEQLRGEVVGSFAGHYRRVAKRALKTGQEYITGYKKHRIGILPGDDQREALRREYGQYQSDVAAGRQRRGGKFAAQEEGSARTVAESRIASRRNRPQMNMVGASVHPDEVRTTLGERAENEIGSLVNHALYSGRWNPNSPTVQIAPVTMDGDFVKQQRAVKLIKGAKKIVLAMGAGSGKTGIMLGAHAELHHDGSVRRALYAVPSVVQGQFATEAQRFLDPRSKLRIHAVPGEDAASRYAAYADPGQHGVVVTHQALREDTGHALAELLRSRGQTIDSDTALAHLATLPRKEKAALVKAAFDHVGWHGFDALFVDEAHDTTARAGQEGSKLSHVVDAIGDNASYYVPATGTPVKNDASEAFDMLAKVSPSEFSDRDAFLRQYGSPAAADSLRALWDRYAYASKVSPKNVQLHHTVEPITLHPDQRTAYEGVRRAYSKARAARQKGSVDVDSLRTLSPNSFVDQPASQHEEIARNLQSSLGTLRDSAYNRVINSAPAAQNAKVQRIVELANQHKAAGEQSGIVFAHNLESVHQISTALAAAGHRIVTITGADSAQDKHKKKMQHSPEGGASPQADILVMSDAGATGMNLQRANWVVNHDVPLTDKNYEQRNARSYRLGQKRNVTAHLLVSDTDFDQRAQKRLGGKGVLARVFQDPYNDDTGLAGYLKREHANG